MKRAALLLIVLIAMSAAAEAVILLQVHPDPRRLAAILLSLSLTLCAFAGLSQPSLVRYLRQRAVGSVWAAAGLPLLLLVPYLVYAFGTGSFSYWGAGKLLAYVVAPTLLLLPDRLHRPAHLGWRDVVAMVALGLPVGANWLAGIWTWPHDLYSFRPLFCVCVGMYAFAVVRNLEGVGYRLLWRKQDVVDGFANFLAFCLFGIPLGMALQFIHPHFSSASLWRQLPLQFFGIYLTVAIPEELLFRGILQNLLCRSIRRGPAGVYGLLIAAVVFGASHLHHAPVPNWRYAILATLAGVFYGYTFRNRQRISASALTHALVDTTWHFWF
jgi:membrane protease YdiL (CAAX protease family)